MISKNPRIFIGMRELSGYYHHLKKGFDQLGLESVFVNLSGHPFDYGEGNNPKFINMINKISQSIGLRFFSNFAARLLWMGLIQNIFGFFIFFWAIFRFDVFIFSSNSTFFYFLDLPFLKLFKKKIIYVFHGSESRPVYLNGYVLDNTRTSTILMGIALARIQKRIIRIIERYTDYSISIPPQGHFHERPIVSWLCIGIPHDVGRMRSVKDAQPSRRDDRELVRILHAPSKPIPKGTPEIRRIMRSLKEKGYPIDYREITGKSNAEVLEEIDRCDFIVDELYSDTPMAVFAAEAAFAGKPAVVGSYYADLIENDLVRDLIPPSAFCHPDRLEETIISLVENPELRARLGNAARTYVHTRWEASVVAKRYLMLIEDCFPKEWLFNPYKIQYIYGCGLPREKARQIVGKFIKLGGTRSLCVADKPELMKQLHKFAAI
ncbi:MAG: hypothetical protein QM278_02790 [Pseudomonadota bacterium]|nr:hypothetical protein [Pseudomonadota bacterium]